MATETELTIRYSRSDDCFHVISEREVEVDPKPEPEYPLRMPKEAFVHWPEGMVAKDVILDKPNG